MTGVLIQARLLLVETINTKRGKKGSHIKTFVFLLLNYFVALIWLAFLGLYYLQLGVFCFC